ncbi:MAG TPA: DUF72 domain-containing protein [Candidatus Anoxymicrobiaceae bacterium]|jgi:uncharacterized protein YecE (DUF72 family)
MAELFVGTSGWVYPHWKERFYPEDMPESEWFKYYARHFDTVEINNSFYRLPSRETFDGWRQMAPTGFRFTVKASRYITHVKKLKDPGTGLENFYTNLAGMGRRCAAVLFQLPPRWHVNLERLEEFLGAVHNRYRSVLEFGDDTWLNDDVFDLMSSHGVALCAADSPFYPAPRKRTADFSFWRMHGGHLSDSPGYERNELWELAQEVGGELEEGRDCFVYFNNDYACYAIENALELKSMLSEVGG